MNTVVDFIGETMLELLFCASFFNFLSTVK